jgi:hypothetical protein
MLNLWIITGAYDEIQHERKNGYVMMIVKTDL